MFHHRVQFLVVSYSNKSRGVRKKKLEAQGPAPAKSQAEIVSATEEKAPLEVRRAWAYLVAKVYEVDPLVCPDCGSRMKIIALCEALDYVELTSLLAGI